MTLALLALYGIFSAEAVSRCNSNFAIFGGAL